MNNTARAGKKPSAGTISYYIMDCLKGTAIQL